MVGTRPFPAAGAPAPATATRCVVRVREEDGMKKSIFGAGLAVAIATVSAQAADLPRGHIGPMRRRRRWRSIAGWARISAPISATNGARPRNNPTEPSGIVGGVQAGYNLQSGQFVFGGEADINLSGADDTFAPWKFSNPWFGTVRGRAGVAPEQRPVLRDRRSCLRQSARRSRRVVGESHRARLDRGPRRRSRLDARTGRSRSNISISI